MNRPSRRALAGQMLAYVDDCLPPDDRRALEHAMTENPDIRRQVEAWVRQNDCIRAAFAGPPVFGGPAAAGGRFAPAAFAPGRAPRVMEAKRQGEDLDRRRPAIAPARDRRPGAGAASTAARRAIPARRRGGVVAWRIARVFAVALALWCVSAAPRPGDPAIDFAAAGAAAYRTFGGDGARPVEVATNDRAALQRWFAAAEGRVAAVPDLAAAGWSLLGGRIAPGASSPAQFILYQNVRRERIGVAIEPLDSPPTSQIAYRDQGGVRSASWTAAGHGFAVLGGIPGAPIGPLARLIRDGAPPPDRTVSRQPAD